MQDKSFQQQVVEDVRKAEERGEEGGRWKINHARVVSQIPRFPTLCPPSCPFPSSPSGRHSDLGQIERSPGDDSQKQCQVDTVAFHFLAS